MMWNASSPMTRVIALALFGASVLLAWIWWPAPTPPVPPADQTVALPPAVTAPTVEIPGTATQPVGTRPAKPPIKAVQKTPDVRRKTKLPPAMLDGDDIFLTATGELQSEDDRRYTLSSVLDRRTGETQVYAVAEPAPWLALESKGAVGVAYGLNEDGERTTLAYWRHSLIRSKAFRAGTMITADDRGRGFVGASIEWRY